LQKATGRRDTQGYAWWISQKKRWKKSML